MIQEPKTLTLIDETELTAPDKWPKRRPLTCAACDRVMDLAYQPASRRWTCARHGD